MRSSGAPPCYFLRKETKFEIIVILQNTKIAPAVSNWTRALVPCHAARIVLRPLWQSLGADTDRDGTKSRGAQVCGVRSLTGRAPSIIDQSRKHLVWQTRARLSEKYWRDSCKGALCRYSLAMTSVSSQSIIVFVYVANWAQSSSSVTLFLVALSFPGLHSGFELLSNQLFVFFLFFCIMWINEVTFGSWHRKAIPWIIEM